MITYNFCITRQILVDAIHCPRLTEAAGRYPPEDIGGPPGYDEFIEALAKKITPKTVKPKSKNKKT